MLVTLLVVSFLLILVLAFTVIVRAQLREVVNRQQLMAARANARLGANMALASLQQTLGPDQRVTARGGMLTSDNLSGMRSPDGAARLVGAWDSTVYDEMDPTTHANGFLGWLVSSGTPGLRPSLNQAAPAQTDPAAIRLIGSGTVENASDHLYARKVAWEGNGFAWVVDDEGLKAQLGATFSNVRGDLAADPPPGGGVLPGAYPPGALTETGMNALAGVDPPQLEKLNSLREVALLPGFNPEPGGPGPAPSVYYDYTLSSQGVLANARDGGLKKDLTIAFENDTVFERVFTNGPGIGGAFDERYLLIDPDKLASPEAADLRENGYIHWNIFRDYYNLKQYIRNESGIEIIDSVLFNKTNVSENRDGDSGTYAISQGTLAPHDMGDSAVNTDYQQGQPYRNFPVRFGGQNTFHNHVGPVLSTLQMTAWLEYEGPVPTEDSEEPSDATLTPHFQIWTAHYNPYNIGLSVIGFDSENGNPDGVRIQNYPQFYVQLPELPSGGENTRWLGSPGNTAVIPGGWEPTTSSLASPPIRPGRSQVFGIEADFDSLQLRDTKGAYGPNVRDNLINSVTLGYDDRNHIEALDPDTVYTVNFTFRFDWVNKYETFVHGSDFHKAKSVGGILQDLEATQVIYVPFASDSGDAKANGFPAKIFSLHLPPSEMNMNANVATGISLRTTRDTPENRAIRPLVDANIRAPWVNPRWDGSLGVDLDAPAAYQVMSKQNVGVQSAAPDMAPGSAGDGSGFAYLGAGHSREFGATRVVLFDIPREDLLSTGQLQHAAAGKFSYEPTYVVGNSYANPRIPLNQWRGGVTDTFSPARGLARSINGSFNLYDASYLVNERVWDEFTFTTLPQVRDNRTPGEPAIDYEAIRTGAQLLPNPRYIPYIPEGSAFTRDVMRDEGDSNGTAGGFFHNAGHLLVDGAFNVNSTSVAAWEAFLTGTLDLPVQGVDDDGDITGFKSITQGRVRFPRVKSVHGEGMDTGEDDNVNYWTGFRELTRTEVRDIAEAIVTRVKRRGPFLNMGQFVNRMLRNDELGESGVLQAALDATVNQGTDSDLSREADGVYGGLPQGTGYPGQLLQGDLLQALAPLMQVRSDTFTIRAYGETASATGDVAAKAWCELRVQRVPDAVLDDPGSLTPEEIREELAMPSSPFGRKFNIVSFRWLAEDEI